MVRFYTPNLNEACDALNLYDIDYDLDDVLTFEANYNG